MDDMTPPLLVSDVASQATTDPLATALGMFVEQVAQRVAALVLSELAARQPEPMSPYLTVGEAAAYLRTSRQRIYDLCSEGRLPRRKDGHRLLLLREDLDRYVREAMRA